MNNNKGFIVPLLLGIIVLLAVGGGIYVYQNKKAEVPVVTDTNTQKEGEVQKNASISLAPQVGLPALVEAKRQAIYKAALSHDFKKLEAELKVAKELYTLYGFDANGKSKMGISGYQKSSVLEYEKNVNLFDLIPTLLKLPYSVTNVSSDFPYEQNWWASENFSSNTVLYTWPSVVIKSPKDWKSEDIDNMKTFLTDEQIELFREHGYAYFNVVITSGGEWISGYGRKD